MDKIDIQQLCECNIQCKTINCDKKHYRCFVGICIRGLKENENSGKCQLDDCKLNHQPYENLLEVITINGINKYNICPNINKKCKNQIQPDCVFLHPDWAIMYCFEYIMNKCKNEECLKHIKWNNLQKEIHNQFDINNLNPENLCYKSNCYCGKHLQIPQQICVQNFLGLCPLIKCSKSHQTWEEFKKGYLPQKAKIQPCTKINKKIYKQSNEEPNGNSVLFFKKSEMDKIKQLQFEIRSENILDVIFIMDLTGSMEPWIRECQNSICSIIDDFLQKIPVITLRIAFVGYRDFQKHNYNNDHVVCHDFTEDVNKIKYFITHQKARSGGDQAEDIISGLEKATQLNISKHPESTLISILFADAPNHGIQYHNGVIGDDQKYSIKEGSLERLIQQYKQLKLKNFFTCVTINSTTDKMYQIMQKEFPELVISQTKTPKDLSDYITFTLHESYRKSKEIINKPVEDNNNFRIKAKFIETKYLQYSLDNDPNNRKEMWTKINEYIYNQENLQQGQTTLTISKEYIRIEQKEDGVQSYIFKLFDTENNSYMITKIPKKYFNTFQQNGQQTDEEIQKAENSMENRFLSQSIAKQLAQKYRQKTQNMDDAPPIFFASPIIYELSQPFYGLKKIYAESFIDQPQIEWKKYTNNTNFIDENSYYYTSFSHFTYEETGGVLIITDLQGKKNILSDPSIQTESFNSSDSTNIKEKGIEYFKMSHQKCNIICKKLKLKCFNSETQLDYTKWNWNQTENIIVMCDTCNQFQEILQDEYNNQSYKKCKRCQLKEQECYTVQCSCCLNNCNIHYTLLANKQVRSYICEECKQKCQGDLQSCIYCRIYCKRSIKSFIVDGKKQYICQTGLNYLQTLKCQQCYTLYQKDVYINRKEYKQGDYRCLKCQQLKK